MPIIKYGHRHSFFTPNTHILVESTLHQNAQMNRHTENERVKSTPIWPEGWLQVLMKPAENPCLPTLLSHTHTYTYTHGLKCKTSLLGLTSRHDFLAGMSFFLSFWVAAAGHLEKNECLLSHYFDAFWWWQVGIIAAWNHIILASDLTTVFKCVWVGLKDSRIINT